MVQDPDQELPSAVGRIHKARPGGVRREYALDLGQRGAEGSVTVREGPSRSGSMPIEGPQVGGRIVERTAPEQLAFAADTLLALLLEFVRVTLLCLGQLGESLRQSLGPILGREFTGCHACFRLEEDDLLIAVFGNVVDDSNHGLA